ncbi:RAMP superfamily CRISPR-associated protein [Salipiger abyssi]|uniref:RAMP superfamily CRISPR-associated protein n=1 Tax=Salipiger abyssi TaxID=1250539 RepID=UPI001A8FA09F|nr:RAMP superfamily CRISPR-associated protein [Salipiger abyssi]MBN9890540.1 hypothetical protein [Salipiger abyssi]
MIYSFKVIALSPIHVGNGGVRQFTEAEITSQGEGKKKEAAFGEVATLQRDHEDRPYIPGSSLKGALRAAATHVDVDVERLFGMSHEMAATKPLRAAATVLGTAALSGGEILVRRTSVDLRSGVAQKGLLFAQEFAAEGALFDIKLVVETPAPEFDKICRDMETVLGVFVGKGGLDLGANKADGMGRLALNSALVTATEFVLGPDGWRLLRTPEVKLSPFELFQVAHRLPLYCNGPYLSRDGVEVRTRKTREGELKTQEVTQPARRSGDLPLLTGMGVSGALRSRAAWLLRLRELQTGRMDEKRICPTSAGEMPLNTLERLFGHEGFRGALALRIENVSRQGGSEHPSVRLDPVTQAPISGALFAMGAHNGVGFDLELGWFREPDDEVSALLNLLLEDIEINGLKLGAATSRGFGWFNATPELTPKPLHMPPVNKDKNEEADPTADLLPSPEITLPYRLAEVDLKAVGMPQEIVLDAFASDDKGLHATPFADGLSGHVDVDWVFDTPLLIGDGGDIRRPQKIGSHYILPGSTLKGLLRSVLETATNARIGRLNDAALSPEEIRQGRKSFPYKPKLEQIRRASTASDLNPHNPPLDARFLPDFCQALFGFGLDDDEGHLPHERAHLKSRLGFGFAWAVSDVTEDKPRKITFAEPRPTAVFYDHVGRKRYQSTKETSSSVFERLENMASGTDEMASTVRYLVPKRAAGKPAWPMVFRGRIAFHNLTPVELGALMFALLPEIMGTARHQVGQGRMAGAGRCRAANLDLLLQPNDGSKPTAAAPAEFALWGLTGHTLFEYRKLFLAYLEQIGRDGATAQGTAELLASLNPRVGKALREDAGLKRGELKYQTKQTLGKDACKRIAGQQDGRLAAMLKRARR